MDSMRYNVLVTRFKTFLIDTPRLNNIFYLICFHMA